MNKKPNSCVGCPLEVIGKGFSNVEGSGALPMLIAGEASGYREMLQDLPFRPDAEAGSVLQRVINMTKFSRQQFVISNMVRCHPPQDKLANTSYEYGAINHCRSHFERTLEQYKPKVILACGNLPFKHLVGDGFGGIQQIRGYVFRAARYSEILVIPTLHPSFIKRGNMKYMELLLRDLHKATLIAQGKLIEGQDFMLDPFEENWTMEPHGLEYITNPTLEDAQEFLRQVQENPNLLVAYDIETETSAGTGEDELEEYGTRITQVQFSTAPNSGIALPFEEPFIEIATAILASTNQKLSWNGWRFDRPILKKAGIPINGREDDLMWCHHHYKPDLPLGLQQGAQYWGHQFPWKHYAFSDLSFYGVVDAAVLSMIYPKLRKEMEKRGLWGVYDSKNDLYTGYEGLVYHINPILEKASERGIPINQEKQEEFSKEIDKEKQRIQEEINPLIPENLLKLHPENGYVREPKEVAEVLLEWNNPPLLTDANLETVLARTGYSRKAFIIDPPKPRKKKGESLSFTDQLSDLESQPKIEVERWVKVLPFNPNSVDQISNYIKYVGDEDRARKAATKIAKEKPADDENARKKKDNVTTSADVLRRLHQETGNPVYKMISDFKGLTKMQGTYCKGDYKPGNDGRIHPEYLFRPATMQLSARKPNSQNYPAHSDLAKKFKRTIEARPGHTLIKADMKSFHALLVGWLAKDKDYMRLARLDIHSYVAGFMLGLFDESLLQKSDLEIMSILKEVKKNHVHMRNQCKRTILGIPYGLGEVGCYERFRDDFNPSPEEANRNKRKPLEGEKLQKEIQRLGKLRVKNLYVVLHRLFPRVFRWQLEVKRLAHDQGYLQTPYGARREFAAVRDFKYTGTGREILEEKNGLDAEKAASFLPQNNAFCHMRESMLLMEKEGLMERYGFINTIHDSFEFECPDDLVQEAVQSLTRIMTRESKVLVSVEVGAFQCGVDISVGRNLLEMEEIKC